jgi:predicted acylesterase/phospholipase RssA
MKEFTEIPAPETLRGAQVDAGKRDARTTLPDDTPRSYSWEAVCFTAGVDGTPFAAGVIHAYLAADRPPPAIAAGISAGALSASAMAASFEELGACSAHERTEAKRWRWFRTYLEALSNRPLDVFWRGVPSFAELSTLGGRLRPLADPATPEQLKKEESDSLKRRFLLQHLGSWLCRLPITVRQVAGFLVNTAVSMELNLGTRPERLFARVRSWALLAVLVWRVLQHVVFSPQFLNESPYMAPDSQEKQRPLRLRPLFGWRGWLASTLVFGASVAWLVALVIAGLGRLMPLLGERVASWWSWLEQAVPLVKELSSDPLVLLGLVAGPVVLVLLVERTDTLLTARANAREKARRRANATSAEDSGVRSAIVGYLIERTGVARSILSDFYLLRFLCTLFELDLRQTGAGKEKKVGSFQQPRLLLVASPLQTLPRLGADPKAPGGQERAGKTLQLWARDDTSLLKALRAALAMPGLFAPSKLPKEEFERSWVGSQPLDMSRLTHAELVDGAVIRTNPLPALFTFLDPRQGGEGTRLGDEIEKANSPERPGVHVVYSIAVDKRQRPDSAEREPIPDIIEAAMKSLRLARRCDTELEVLQTNFMATVERTIRVLKAAPGTERNPEEVAPRNGQGLRGIYADEIAPATHEPFSNLVAPTRDEVLTASAEGCRRTLGRLYAREILTHPNLSRDGKLKCGELLAQVAPRRGGAVHNGEAPGCGEICKRCTAVIEVPRELQRQPDEAAPQESGGIAPMKAEHFPQLSRRQPRVVLVTSGGVFRGAFHVGLAGALMEIGLKPDLIVGASVGTLMGAVTGALFHLNRKDGRERLQQLADIFLKVDQKVAHTRSLLNAVRTLALRSTSVNLSPRDVFRMLHRGARGDAGFAAVGSPPALLDALADMFLLPHRATAVMASLVVTGRFAKATRRFLQLVRRETLPRLDVREALLGTSLLELRARELLELSSVTGSAVAPGGAVWWKLGTGSQPFMGPRHENGGTHIAFFGTATDLWTEKMELLGGVAPGDEPYDIVEAALASSAFPSVFSPRRESQIRPGTGRAHVVFADGGMFDNLPFIPAMNILRTVQVDELKAGGGDEWVSDARLIESLKERFDAPDLFIVGALNVNPEETDSTPIEYRHLTSILKRSRSLRDNVKIRSVERASRAVDRQIERLWGAAREAGNLDDAQRKLIAGIVSASILPVFPTSPEHLNPTFAFSPSTGFKPERVSRSIADGCYQTMRGLSQDTAGMESGQLARALKAVRGVGKLQGLRPRVSDDAGKRQKELGTGLCPFYEKVNKETGKPERFECPFVVSKDQAAKSDVYRQCISDPVHGHRSSSLLTP